MPIRDPKLTWCIVRLGNDYNWWVKEISNPIHWDMDGLSILDPKQVFHLLDLMDPLKTYGLDTDVVDRAFFKFRIDKRFENDLVRLTRVEVNLIDSDEPLFALPNAIDEEKGPYADLIHHITQLRTKLLNDSIEFTQNLDIDDILDDLSEQYHQEFFEGNGLHCYRELTDILEYVPQGFELDSDVEISNKEEDKYADLYPETDEEEEKEELDPNELTEWEDEESNLQ